MLRWLLLFYTSLVCGIFAGLIGLSLGRACVLPICDTTEGFLIPDGGTVPSNLAALHWYPVPLLHGMTLGVEDFQVWRYLDEGGIEEVDVDIRPLVTRHEGLPGFEVRFVTPLEAHTTYRVRAPLMGCRGHHGRKYLDREFSTADIAPLPKRLGRLRLGPLRPGALTLETPGRCRESFDVAYRHVEIDLDEGAKPWRDVLLWETRVEGGLWRPRSGSDEFLAPGASWVGRGRDRVYRLCESWRGYEPVLQGPKGEDWRIEVWATLPGEKASLATAPVDAWMFCPGLTLSRPALAKKESVEREIGLESVVERDARDCGAGGTPAISLVLFGLLMRKRRAQGGE